MRKSRVVGEIVRLNKAAFSLSSDQIRAGNLDALVDAALSRVLGGGTEEVTCAQYTCHLYAPKG